MKTEYFTEDELRQLVKRAKEVIPGRVAFYAEKAGVRYGKITIRKQHTRWGSCSSEGNLSFNCLLVLTPPEVLDSVVVHELCHRKVMNHSRQFYDEVRRLCPDYQECRTWLREHGAALIAKLPPAKRNVRRKRVYRREIRTEDPFLDFLRACLEKNI